MSGPVIDSITNFFAKAGEKLCPNKRRAALLRGFNHASQTVGNNQWDMLLHCDGI